jgi:glycosyltransferase involved in cell wall biosynthesis
MVPRRLRILQIMNQDLGGGASQIAWNLFRCYRAQGHASWLAVSRKLSADPDILQIPTQGSWAHFWYVQMRGAWRLGPLHHWTAEPGMSFDRYFGIEEFRYPGSHALLNLPPEWPHIVHCHNLHGWYFDLRMLPKLSRQLTMVMTLHDEWMLTGHCAYTFGCERWRIGCGSCPDLTIYPAIEKDATAYNWRRKQRLYAQSKLYISTPSQWLMDKVQNSMLAPAIVKSRVIHNGVDLSVFCPGDMLAARLSLGIPQDAKVLLFAANNVRQNMFKDFSTIRAAAGLVSNRLPGQKVLLIGLGDDKLVERVDQAEVHLVPFQSKPESVAQYYRAADCYVHAAKADNFPNTILEALACGKPVVATTVGGIPEQVKGLKLCNNRLSATAVKNYEINEATGAMVPKGDAEAMASVLVSLLRNHSLRRRLGENAVKDARQRFDLQSIVGIYLEWYRELLEEFSLYEEHGSSCFDFFAAAQVWASAAGIEAQAPSFANDWLPPLCNFAIFAFIIVRFALPLGRHFLQTRRAQILLSLKEASAKKQPVSQKPDPRPKLFPRVWLKMHHAVTSH